MNMMEPFTKDIMFIAWEHVKAKGKSGGIDGKSLHDFERQVDRQLAIILQSLIDCTYVPDPPMTVKIPKYKPGEFRTISLLTVRDKVVQWAVKLMIEKMVEATFSPFSYAYRENKGHQKLIQAISGVLKTRFVMAHALDIDDFFDSLDRDILLSKLQRVVPDPFIVHLVDCWQSMGSVTFGVYKDRISGIPQGAILSPLLSNLYLTDFDHWIKNQFPLCHYVRYADNFLVIAKDNDHLPSPEVLNQRLSQTERLRLNEWKNDPFLITTGIPFCGILFQSKDTYNIHRTILPEKLNQAKSQINQNRSYLVKGFSEYCYRQNELLNGWKRYYQPYETEQQLKMLQKEMETAVYQVMDEQLQKGAEKQQLVHIVNEKIHWIFSPQLKKPKDTSPKMDGDTIPVPKKLKTELVVSHETKSLPKIPSVKRKVMKKRRQFKKLLSHRYDLFLDTPGQVLGKQANKVVVREKGKIMTSITTDHLKTIGVMASSCSISSDILFFCAQKGIRFEILNGLGVPLGFIASPDYTGWKVSRAQEQVANTLVALQIAKKIILTKIHNQWALCKYALKNKDQATEAAKNTASTEFPRIFDYLRKINELPFDENDASWTHRLMGYEGMAASSYWAIFKDLLPPDIPFHGRVRKGATDIVNSCLNYGYGILYNRMQAAVMRADLNPSISVIHAEQKDKPTLVYDLVEIFRQPLVDRVVLKLFRRHQIKANQVTKSGELAPEVKKMVADAVFERLYLPFYHHEIETCLDDLIESCCKDFANFLTKKNTKWIPYKLKW